MGWGMFGSLSYALGRFAVFILLTKYLPVQQVGQFVLALAVVTPLSFLVNLELRVVYVTDTSARIHAGQCLAFRLITNGVFLIVLLLVGWGLSYYWGWEKSTTLWLVGLVRCGESIGDIYLGVLQKKEWIKQFAVSQTLKTVGVFFWSWLILVLVADLRWLLVGWFMVVVLAVWFYDRPWAQKITPVRCDWSRRLAYELLKLAWPLGLLITVTSFHESVARLFLEHFHSDKEVAYYAALTMVVAGCATLQNGINQAILAPLARYANQAMAKFWKLLGGVLLLSWLAMALALLLVWWQGKWILQRLYNPGYAQHVDVFVIVVLAGGFLLSSMILGDAVLACRRFRSRLFAVIIGLAVNIIGCSLTVAKCGLAGAAWSALAASATVTLICGFVLVRTSLDRRCGQHLTV